MNLKEVFVADLKATLEETANIMADRVILESLAKNGAVSLDEAEFFDSLVRRIITEAAEEFVPESIDLSYLQEEADFQALASQEPMILTAEDGTVYEYNPATGELAPIEGAEGPEAGEEGQVDAEAGEEDMEDLESNEGDHADSDVPEVFKEGEEVEVAEAEEVVEEAQDEVVEEAADETVEEAAEDVVEESEVVGEAQVELTESQLIVSNLIKSLGN